MPRKDGTGPLGLGTRMGQRCANGRNIQHQGYTCGTGWGQGKGQGRRLNTAGLGLGKGARPGFSTPAAGQPQNPGRFRLVD
ncbi:DUF5320 domain-containing protein [Pelobacter seleniigenes]|uniref:DUF5320 domain-containing protein n=1 Tax=Pelobacter seleniigenes TaxID=407188 RepID=UPI0004A6F8BE|nr:DUF5320 domain-containing protein [Pelobacter seleniigenes]